MSLADLLSGARQLQSQIQDDSDLPALRRNITQLQSQAREQSANLQGLDEPAGTDAQTFRFLATQGVDATLDPMALDLVAGAEDAHVGLGNEDLDSFLQREEQRMLVDAVERNKQMTVAEFSRSYWGKVEADWQAQKPLVVEALRFHSAAPQASGAPVVASAPETSLHALGRSRVRGARALAYSQAISDLWKLRVARQTDFSLMERMTAAAKTNTGSAAVKLHSCWQLLAYMVRELQPLRPSGTFPADEAPYQQLDGPQGLKLRCALLRGALRHLGVQKLDDLRKRIETSRDEARRGGQPGTELDAAAYVRLLARSRAGTPAEQIEGDDVALWPVVFWCVRCGDLAAAARVLGTAVSKGTASSSTALLALLNKMADAQGGGAGASAAPTLAAAVRAAQDEYWVQKQKMEEGHQLLLYSVLAAPEPKAKMGDLLPSGEPSIEDWLWHRLSMVLVQMECGVDAVGPASPSHALTELQRLLAEQYGEAYFNKGGGSPLLFFSVLLHSQQFEKAVAFLSREERGRPSAALADMGEEALHFALALLHEGLLSCAYGAEAAPDGTPLEQHGRLLLPTLLKQHLMAWGGEDRAMALQYVWMLRGEAAVREALALDVLEHGGGDGSVLSQSLPFLELQPPSKRHLMVQLAERLHAGGLSTQAMWLLYQVGTSQAAGGLVARPEDELRASRDAFSRLAELLLDGISKQLVNAHASGTTRVADAAAPLRADARRFLQQWQASDPEGCYAHGGALRFLLQAGELLGAVDAWQQQRRDEQGEVALSQALQLLDEMPLLPAEPVHVDQKQAEFRQVSPALQRAFPALLEAAMCATHAKFLSLKMPRAAGVGNAAEMMKLRRRGEALVAMSSVSSWAAAEVLGQLQMPTAVNQRLVSWLAEMA